MRRVVGSYDPAFRAVAAAFDESFAAGQRSGAALSVAVDGRVVADIWGGTADSEGVRPWHRDTVVNVFSATKGITALCAHLLAARGALDLDAPVSGLWPEFRAAGKGVITIAQLLDHSAGLPAIREWLPAGTLFDWPAMTSALAAEEPWWEPSTRHGYHAITFGFLVGEVVRRASGKRVRDVVRDVIATPLGADLSIGLPENLAGRAAYLPPTEPPSPTAADHPFVRALRDPDSLAARAFFNPRDLSQPGAVDTARWRSAEIPASNGYANARGLARMYASLTARVDGVRLLDPERVRLLATERVGGHDVVLCAPTRFSLGFMLPSELRPFARGPRAFGHPGAGGALGFADPDARLGFGYTPSRTLVALEGGDPRWAPLVDAVYACL